MKILLLILLFFPANFSFAYTPETTHAGLSEQAVYFYDDNFSNKLSNTEKELIINGSIAEDYPEFRVLNHFYDPIRGIGVNNFRTAKDWAVNKYTGNLYVWSEAIKLYAEDDKEKALLYLGHTMHLIQDMTVPDHTRNDAHVGAGIAGLYTGESSYEKWSSDNKDRQTLRWLNTTFLDEKPKIFENLDDYFDFLANYSNRNFFGDDSVNNNVYQYEQPRILESDSYYGYGKDGINGEEFKLIKKIYSKKEGISFALFDNSDTAVLSGYFDRLSKQAILAGAGVIDLFFREGEKARVEYLKEKAMQAEAEIKKAVELNKTLGNSNSISLVLFGLNYIIWDKVISPIENGALSITSNFSSGSKIIYSAVSSAESFLAFSSGVIIKEAFANTKEVMNKIVSSTQKFMTSDPRNNLANIPELILETPEIEISKTNKIPKAEIFEEQINREEVSDNNAISLLNLSNALNILEDLSKNLTKQPIKEISKIYASAPYSPGFGGGETQIGNPTTKLNIESSVHVDKPVEKGVKNLGTNLNSENNAEDTSSVEENLETEELATSTATSTSESIFEAVSEIFEETFTDTTPPDTALVINECKESLSLGGCLLTTTSLNIMWSSNALDLSFFEINNNGAVSTTTATGTMSMVSDNSVFNFSVLAVDNSGNKSELIENTAEIVFSPVIINEIAWNGTTGHPEDEWIELYNRTDKIIELDNWTLYSKTDLSPYLKLKGKILPHNYYLIERKNDGEENELTQSPIKNIEANLWISFGMGISNSGENIILSYSSTTIDELPLLNNWAGRSNQRTFERYDVNKSAIASNWISNNGEIINGINVTGAAIFGTPKARNSASYLINKNTPIVEDLILKKADNPYYIPKNSVIDLRENIKLKIEPGVIIKFGDGSTLKADGNIILGGTKEDPIVFTSLGDDDYGGDTNNDGTCDKNNASSTSVCPYPGSFYGLSISNKSASSSVSNSIFRYGGLSSGIKRGILNIDSSPVEIFNSFFEYSASDGVYLTHSDSTLLGNKFTNNGSGVSNAGIYISGGAPRIEDNTFSLNSVGIYSNASDADVLNNKFSKNKYRAINLLNKIGGNILENNSLDGNEFESNSMINISGNISILNATTTLMSNPMPYFIYGTVSVVASSTLYIGEGTNIINSNSGMASRLIVNGKLIVDGDTSNPVIFSSDQENGVKGSWQGILLGAGSSSHTKGAIFKDATNAISYFKSAINLEDVEFKNNLTGVFVGLNPSPVEKAINVHFEDTNSATTSPKNLW